MSTKDPIDHDTNRYLAEQLGLPARDFAGDPTAARSVADHFRGCGPRVWELFASELRDVSARHSIPAACLNALLDAKEPPPATSPDAPEFCSLQLSLAVCLAAVNLCLRRQLLRLRTRRPSAPAFGAGWLESASREHDPDGPGHRPRASVIHHKRATAEPPAGDDGWLALAEAVSAEHATVTSEGGDRP